MFTMYNMISAGVCPTTLLDVSKRINWTKSREINYGN